MAEIVEGQLLLAQSAFEVSPVARIRLLGLADSTHQEIPYSRMGQVANLALTAFSEVRSVRLSGVRV
jgi:hypothetical protein